MTHRYHPDPDKGEVESFLYDDCDRCDQQADDPRNLDDIKLARAYEASKQDDWSGTKNERKVLGFMYKVWCINERLAMGGDLP